MVENTTNQMQQFEAYLVLNGRLRRLVEVDLDQSGAVQADTCSLAHDLGRVDQVGEVGVVHGGQRSVDRSLLLVDARLSARLRQDGSLRDEHHMLAGELLLQLSHQSRLQLLPGLQLWRRDEDGQRFLALHRVLLHTDDLQLSQLVLDLRGHLELEQRLTDGVLDLVQLLALALFDLRLSRQHFRFGFG